MTKPETAGWSGAVCTQPECALRKMDFNRTRLAELLVQAVSHEGLAPSAEKAGSVPERERIVPRKVCTDCALRVVRGQRPFPTADEKNRALQEIESRWPSGFVDIK